MASKRRGRVVRWDPPEDGFLREWGTRARLDFLAVLLPWRTAGAIKARLYHLGVKPCG